MHMSKHVEPESATDAARLDNSGCATVTMKYDQFLDDCNLEKRENYISASSAGSSCRPANDWIL